MIAAAVYNIKLENLQVKSNKCIRLTQRNKCNSSTSNHFTRVQCLSLLLAYSLQYSKENRDNALRHLEEASEFLSRIEAKKSLEITKWREKLKCIKERQKLLEYYRQKKSQEKKHVRFRKRHEKSRKSVWNVDRVLLKEIIDNFTEDERKELEEYHLVSEIDLDFFLNLSPLSFASFVLYTNSFV